MRHTAGNEVEHHIEAGVAADDDILGAHLHHLRQNRAQLGHALRHTVIAQIVPGGSDHIGVRRQHIEHIHRKIQLFGRGLSSGHIQLQTLCLESIILLLNLLLFLFQFLSGQ